MEKLKLHSPGIALRISSAQQIRVNFEQRAFNQ